MNSARRFPSVWVVPELDPADPAVRFRPDHRDNGLFALVACIPALVGVFIGNKLHDRMSGQAFMRLTYVLLIVSGVLCFF